ncbi:hypothetical protein [uncultured Bacteroides sp.]|uniref:hypothetical protein n=1 Tax=uncultured Bacteroides sp. TaxID=162156 RepID=UPI00258D94DD|nr:hypothetical protein [uncultured Bacteroides sp.]
MKNSNDIMFVGFPGSIFSSLLEKHGIFVISPYKYCTRYAYKVRFLLNWAHLKLGYLSELNDSILNYQAKVIIVEGSLIFEPFIKKLRESFPDATIKYLYPNIVADKASLHPDVLRKYGCKLYSWDIRDCLKYKLILTKSFYDKNILKLADRFDYDLCFIGTDKGRYATVKSIKNYADRNGLRFYMHVCPTFNFLRFLHSYYKKPLAYNDYLFVVSKSRCIIDFVRSGQSGTTMRTMEAIFSGQKIISNNDYLKKMDFFLPENIYILKDGNFDGLKDFLLKETVPVDEAILKTYSFEYWYNHLMEDYD